MSDSTEADLRSALAAARRDGDAIKLDCERKVRESYEWGKACLHLAHQAGITDDEVTAQIAYDRNLTALAARREDVVSRAHAAMASVASLASRLRLATSDTVPVQAVIAALESILSGRGELKFDETPLSPPASGTPALFEVAS